MALDQNAVRKRFEGAAGQYDQAAFVQEEVQRRLLERLELTKISPERILDLGTGTGRALKPLNRSYRKAELVALDLALPMLKRAKRRKPRFRRTSFVVGDVAQMPLSDDSIDLVFSNLTLQWVNDPVSAFRELRRMMRDRCLFLFSTFGPDTLRELRTAWSQLDTYPHVNSFYDMHDIGDALVASGFVEPVMDVEYLTVTYAQLRDLLVDIKTIGANTIIGERQRGLMTPRRFRALESAYESFRREAKLPATYEIVYGTAWTPVRLRSRVR